MTELPPIVKRVGHRVVAGLPDPVVDRIPGAVGRRIEAVRAWQRDLPYLAPDSVSAQDNVGYNRSLWDWYADRWSDPDFRSRQLTHEGRAADDPTSVARLGEEWGRLQDARDIIDSWVLPHVDGTAVVGEIGTGGGRVARMVAPKVRQFHAFDVAPKMLELARHELSDVGDARFHVLATPAFPPTLDASFDFLYSFDVFVHLDLHVQWRYLQAIHRALKPGAKAFIHTSNLTATAGWERFAAQQYYRVEGFYFMTPEAVRLLLEKAGFRLLAECGDVPGNFYTERDFLVLFEKA